MNNDFREYRGYCDIYGDSLYHHGIKGQKWGIRRYQNPDGTLTEEGKQRYKKVSGNISFPKHEYKSIQKYLDTLGYCYTTRVGQEVGKYKVGNMYQSPWGDILQIDEVNRYKKVSDRPFYDEMTEQEKKIIRKYSEDMGLQYEFIKFSRYKPQIREEER